MTPSWTTPTSTLLAFSLCETSGAHGVSVEIHPARWTPRVSMEDAVLALLASLHKAPPKSLTIGSQPQAGWSITGQTWGSGDSHPDVALGIGAVQIHTGAPLEGAHTIRLTDQQVVLPDGRAYPRATFSQISPYTPSNAHWARKDIHTTITEAAAHTAPTTDAPYRAAQLAVVWGILSAFAGQSCADWTSRHALIHAAQTIGPLVARMLACSPRSGKAADTNGQDEARQHADSLLTTWALRPDRAWCPRTWVVGQGANALVAKLCPINQGAGAAAARALLQAAPTYEQFNAIQTGQSAHARMAQKALTRTLDNTLLTHWAATPDRLKPMAARRAARLVAA